MSARLHPASSPCQQRHTCPVAAFYAENEAVFPLATAQRQASTTCCHRPDCDDTHCPGRPDRPPHTSVLHSQNSDRSYAGRRNSDDPADPPSRILETQHYWATVALTVVCLGGTALIAALFYFR